MFNSNINASEFILRGIAVIISLTIHEYSHALASTVQGDDTPARYGRLTTNPLNHIDIMGLIALMLFRFGWAKPVPVSSNNYKNRRLGMLITAIAGPLSNLILATISAFVLVGLAFNVDNINIGIIEFLQTLIVMNIGLAIFNMIPFPPLDGSKIFGSILGGWFEGIIYRIDRIGMFILFIILFIPAVNSTFSDIIIGFANNMLHFARIVLNR